MGYNVIKRFFQSFKDGNRIYTAIPRLVKAVNKTHDAAGAVSVSDTRERVQYDQYTDTPTDAINRCAGVLEELAPVIQAQRLKSIAYTQRKETQSAPLQPSENNALADAVIPLRDQILYFKSGAEGGTIKVLDGLYQETGRILSRNGVVPIEDAGEINPERHKISTVKPTPDALLNNTIAETIQPGYMINGELFRPQEVIIYKWEERPI